MSATSDELPVYLVAGANWDCEIQMDPDDAECTRDVQIVEAATKAVEVFKGIIDNDTFKITDDQESPYLGATLFVQLKGTNPDKGVFVFSHIALANGGFYKDSFDAYNIVAEEARKLDQLAEESQESINNLKEDLKNLDRLERKFKSGKKTKTPKGPKKTKGRRKNK
jgi:hypothetical protein